MNYRKVYLAIIAKAIKENRKKKSKDAENYVYYEEHHILPKSLFPAWAKRKSNLVLLTAREHFFCHKLLTHIYPGKAMTAALWLMWNRNHKKDSSREYARTKELMVDYFNVNKGVNTKPWPKSAIMNSVKKRSLPLYCPELNKTFASKADAAKYFGTSPGRIAAQVERTKEGKLYRQQYHILAVSKEG